jgi:hypothetical protein
MKRALLTIAVIATVAAAAAAREYTNIDPPTLAVMDFEVSMSDVQLDLLSGGAAVREETKTYYGELISQALLTVLVQQNASSVVTTPRAVPVVANSTLNGPGTAVYDPGLPAREAKAYEDARRAAEAQRKAGTNAAAASQKLWPTGGQEVRYYFPPIFKIYDKKYVENALQANSFTTKDLYTKAATAFAFADLDFIVLGNVYETTWWDGGTDRPAIGFNVRVLNTKRAEELYSYTAIVRSDLSDLPDACARICQSIMIDILNSHCAQFNITQSAELSEARASADDSRMNADYVLFWQPRQVRKDDGTVDVSDHSNKRKVEENQFYWVLPGTYVISLYNKSTQQLREIPFTIANGAVKNVSLEKSYFDAQNGAITISGIAPTSSYHIKIVPKQQLEQYWWEIFTSTGEQPAWEMTFTNGEFTDGDLKSLAYNPATQEIVIANVALGSYDIQITRNPLTGINGIDGLWQVQSKLSVQSKYIPITLQDVKGIKMKIDDFGLQEKKAIESPQVAQISFILNAGFGAWGWLEINDGLTDDWLYWNDKEKITVSTEYSQADWDGQPQVTYTFWVRGDLVAGGYRYTYWAYTDDAAYTFSKKDLMPSRDTIVFVDMAGLRTFADAKVKEKAGKSASSAQSTTTTLTTTTQQQQQQQSAQQVRVGAQTAQKTSGPLKMSFEVYGGAGYGRDLSTTYAGGADINLGLGLSWALSPGLGLGTGLDFNYVTGSSVGLAGTLDLRIGDPSKSGVLMLIDAGAGYGYMVGGGVCIPNAAKTGGLTLRLGYFNSFGTSSGVFIDAGYIFGF